ncbi:MAG TPA: hypothetical protein VIL44_07700 [Micromonospora sp.]
MSEHNTNGGFTMPSWMGVAEPDPDLATLVLYTDAAEHLPDPTALLHAWYDEACAALLPFVQPPGAPAPKASVTAFEEAANGMRGQRRRPRDWAEGASLRLGQLSAHWYDVAPGAAELDLYVVRFGGRRHLRLQASVGFAERSPLIPRVLAALIELTQRIASRVDLAYGEILRSAAGPTSGTLLDAALRRSPEESADASRHMLRGYEWVTVCPRELAHRLGGPEGLRATGAFAEVIPLPYGAVLLRATPAPEEYRGERVRAVFRALAPVLPPGVPRELHEHDFSRLVFADAQQELSGLTGIASASPH